MKLTKARIEGLEPPERGYQIYWDDRVSGLGVRVTANGAKSFVYQRRINGRTKRMTLDKFPRMSVELAKKRVEKLAAQISDGKDPAIEAHRQAAKLVTLREALDAYLASRDLKSRTVRDINLAMQALKDWMKHPIVEITPSMVEKRHAELGKRSAARANLTMRYLRAVINFAASKWADNDGRPLIAYNPVRRLSATKAWYRVERRRTLLKEHEIPTWWQAVEQLRTDPAVRHGREYRDLLVTLLLTGLRRSEALGLTWDRVDFDDKTVTIEDTKNREPHTLPLSTFLVELLKKRRERASGQYVFGAPDSDQITNFRVVTAYVERASAEIFTKTNKHEQPGIHITPHDLRRTFATIAERLDIPAYALKRLLNHKQTADVTAGYIVADVERLREPMEKITDFVLKAAGVFHNTSKTLEVA